MVREDIGFTHFDTSSLKSKERLGFRSHYDCSKIDFWDPSLDFYLKHIIPDFNSVSENLSLSKLRNGEWKE